jgi:hypothetical protein
MLLQKIIPILAVSALCHVSVSAPETILSHGYVLCGAYSGQQTVLIGKNGETVHTWNHPNLNGYSVYLLENGNLLRTAQVAKDVKIPPGAGPIQGIVEEVDPAGAVVWSYQLANDTFLLHHDIKPMPNGNFLACSFEARTIAEAKVVGVDTALFPRKGTGGTRVLLSERIIEVNPKATGQKIVWQWLLWDHVVPKAQAGEHPELFNGSAGQKNYVQWVHLNGIDYNPKTDLIVFTSRLLCECFVIDHGTTMQEAAGHSGGRRGKGGDFLYRWGNPKNYDTSSAQYVNVLHCPTWIPENCPGAGHILFFHNNMGLGETGGGTDASEVVEIAPPVDSKGAFIKTQGVPFGPEAPTWKYAPSEDFSSFAMSSAFRLPSGNTLVHEAYPPSGESGATGGAGGMGGALSTNSRIREVTSDQKVLWITAISLKSDVPDTGRFQMAWNPAKIMYYPSSYKGIDSLFAKAGSGARPAAVPREYRRGPLVDIRHGGIAVSGAGNAEIRIISPSGKKIAALRSRAAGSTVCSGRLPPGSYIVSVRSAGRAATCRTVAVMP